VGGNPGADLREVGVAADQRPSRGQGRWRCQRRLIGRRRGSRADSRWRRERELVAATRHGDDGLRSEQLAQRRDVLLQVVLLDHQAGPDLVEEFILAHHAVAVPHQQQQQIHRTRAQPHRAVAVQ
jgi:hypothetical protein